MSLPDLPSIDPAALSADDWQRPEPLDLTFEGFSREAFDVLTRLRAQPHIAQYRLEKPAIRRALQEPFKRYRDDLVLNWVIPNRLGFETEKNVFSRLLKNDFGAGGCHHHLWLAFYRPGRKRLTDLQLSHAIDPDGLSVGLYVGDYAKDALARARHNIEADPAGFRAALNPLLATGAWQFDVYRRGTRTRHHGPIATMPDELPRADALWIGTAFSRADVLAWGSDVVRHAIEALRAVWPAYRLFAR